MCPIPYKSTALYVLVAFTLLPAPLEAQGGSANGVSLLKIFLAVIFMVFLVVFAVAIDQATRPLVEDSLAHWHATLPGVKVPTDRFLDTLSYAITGRRIPDVDIETIELFEGGPISSKRPYLRVRRGHHSYYVFGASLGESFFISSWLIRRRSAFARVMLSTPLLGSFFARVLRLVEAETFYVYDSAIHFMEMAHLSLLQVVDAMTDTAATPRLPEEQRKPIMRELYARPQAPQLNL
jgi:hypothetical protein